MNVVTPWQPRARQAVTSLPGRRRASGAVRDKQKEGAGGARRPAAGLCGGGPGLPAGRVRAASSGQQQRPWSKRNARTLCIQTGTSLSTSSQRKDSRATSG
ncbi:hypothetical protein U0070_000651 [Myodes glareolus]|uniref:Uncharacterized protein n=1 Tax=Myodes glareolus TaxID=447135 RepID=A0AAW0IGR8_MYOGA